MSVSQKGSVETNTNGNIIVKGSTVEQGTREDTVEVFRNTETRTAYSTSFTFEYTPSGDYGSDIFEEGKEINIRFEGDV